MPFSASTNNKLALEIKHRANALGFELVGITTASSPDHTPQFQQWLADHFHGELGYMERNAEKRSDPGRVLAGARSVIMVGMNYHSPAPHNSAVPRVARYAWGDRDYHDLIGEKLKQLSAFITDQGGQALSYVDTGPILERDLAQRAG